MAGACPHESLRAWFTACIDWLAADSARRRDAGMIFCNVHETYDGCIRKRTAEEVRAELRGEERRPEPGRRLTWQQAMSELRRRYAGP